MKKIFALLLAAAMCLTLLAACGAGSTDASDSAEETAEAESAEAADTGDEASEEETGEEEPAEEADEEEEDDELMFEDEEIVVYMMYTNAYDQIEDVQEAINAITSERYGITVSMHGFNMGDYATQLSLAISGGEQVDLACMTPIPGSTFSSLTSAGQAMDISGLIDTYCPAVIDEMGDYISAFRIGDAVYGLPIARQKASNLYYRYRSDLAEELGINDAIQNAASFDDLDAMFETIKNETDVNPAGGSRTLNGMSSAFFSQDAFAMTPYDTLGDNLNLVYGDENGKAMSVVENDSYLYMVQKFAQWQEAGYIWGDTVTNTDQTATQLIDAGLLFGEIVATEYGQDNDGYSGAAVNYPVNYCKIGTGMVSTSAVTIWATFVPATAKAPEAALAFLNALYTDADLMNLIDYGIEGQNYVINDAGEATYPEGTTADTCGYHNSDWMIGNSFLMLPSEGQGTDFRSLAREELHNSVVSDYMGFALDSTEMSDLIAGLSSVYEEYGYGMLSGLYTESAYSEFVDKLYAAGLEEYIGEIQTQLDAWSAQ